MNENTTKPFNAPQAVLWDLDGTIIDSEEYWIVAEKELVEKFGGQWSHEDGLTLVGNGLPLTAAILQSKGVLLSIHEIIETLTSRVIEQLNDSIPWRPGAVALIEQIEKAGIPQAIVTMSIERMAKAVSAAITHQPISVVISGDHVSASKPDPEPYLLVAQTLGVEISRCVAIEDSPAGCASAFDAGAFTIGVQNLINLENAKLDYKLDTLAGIDLEKIYVLFSQREVRAQ